jgi:hypothetical protein
MIISEWIPLAEAAAELKLTWAQAYAKALSGRISAKKDGSRWMVSRRSVDAAKASGRVLRNTPRRLSGDV